MSFAARLVAYVPAGGRVADLLLDSVSWDASFPHDDVAALSLSYPSVADAAAVLDGPVELAVEVSAGSGWVEPRNARFLSSEVQSNLADALDVPKYTFRGLGSLLERPFVLRKADNPGKPYDSDDKRNFLSASAGQIILSVVQESRAKYERMLEGVTFGFTASKDSLGADWNKLDSLAFEPGTDLLRILEDATARGICDWWMQGRELMVVNSDSAAVTRSLRLNLAEATESPVRATFEGLATRVALEGAEGRYWEQAVAGASVPYGDRVVRAASDAISTDGTALDLLGRNALQATSPRREYTRAIAVIDSAPLIDWLVGDWVQMRGRDAWESVRVFEAGLSFKASDAVLSARVTLNDRFVDASVRDAKRLRGIAHGTTQNLGSGGIPSRADRAVPAAPKGVAANSLGYWLDAIPFSSVDVSWQAVTADTNGLALNGVDYYEVSCGGQRKRTSSTTIGFDGLQPSRIHAVTVRAVSSTGVQGKTASTEVLTAYPLEVLPPPTAPILRSENGALETVWDGRLQYAAGPGKPPLHFSHVLVEVMRVGSGQWVKYGRDQGAVLVGLTMGDVYRVRLYAVDYLGKESAASEYAQVTITSVAQQAMQHANEVAAELLVEKGRVQKALDDAFAAQGGVDGALASIQTLDARLTPQLDAAKADIVTLNTSTIPALNTTLSANTTQINATNTALATTTGKVNTLENTTIPNLNAALTTVQGVAQSADKRSTVSTAVPSSTTGFPVGAVWQRINAAGAVIGTWRLTASGWVSMPLDPVVIPNLSAGIITSGVISTARLNAEEIAAATGSFLKLNADQIISGTIDTGRLNASSVAAAVATIISLNADRITAGTLGADRIAAASIAASKLVANSIGAGQINASSVAAAVGQFLSVETGQITWDNAAGNNAFITNLIADQAFFRQMLTSRAVIASENLVPDPLFARLTTERGLGAVWDTYLSGDNVAIRWRGTATQGYFDLLGTKSGGVDSADAWLPVTPGDEYALNYHVYFSGYTSWYWSANFHNADGTRTNLNLGVITGAGTSRGPVTFKVPDGARSMSIRAYIQNPDGVAGSWAIYGSGTTLLQKRTGAILLEDGLITTPKLAVGAVDADRIKTGALDAFQITSPLIQSVSTASRGIKWAGANLVGYDGSGNETFRLDATRATITAGIIRTVETANRGIQMDASYLRAWDASGVETFRIAAATGAVTMKGSLTSGSDITGATITGGIVRTATSGQRIQLDSSGDMYAYAPNGLETLRIQTANDDGGATYLRGPAIGDQRSYMRLGIGTVDGVNTAQTWIGFNGGNRPSRLWVHSYGAFYLGGERGSVQIDNSTGELRLYSSAGLVGLYGLPTRSSGGESIVSVLGSSDIRSLYRVTSLRKDKLEIGDLDAKGDPYRVLDLQPRAWYDKTEVEEYARGLESQAQRTDGLGPSERLAMWEGTAKPRRVAGFVAEEVAEVIPELASWDGAGNLSGVQYDRVPAYLLRAVRALKTEVDELKKKVG